MKATHRLPPARQQLRKRRGHTKRRVSRLPLLVFGDEKLDLKRANDTKSYTAQQYFTKSGTLLCVDGEVLGTQVVVNTFSPPNPTLGP